MANTDKENHPRINIYEKIRSSRNAFHTSRKNAQAKGKNIRIKGEHRRRSKIPVYFDETREQRVSSFRTSKFQKARSKRYLLHRRFEAIRRLVAQPPHRNRYGKSTY